MDGDGDIEVAPKVPSCLLFPWPVVTHLVVSMANGLRSSSWHATIPDRQKVGNRRVDGCSAIADFTNVEPPDRASAIRHSTGNDVRSMR